MVRYKMIGRDVNAPYKEYRTWMSDDTPDFDAVLYEGLKSGSSPLEDIVAYEVDDGYYDFHLPNPLSWINTLQKLPNTISASQTAIVDGYVYLFGGEDSDKIYYATLDNPYTWIDSGEVLPSKLSNSQLAVIDGYIYMFGGRISGTTNVIYSAPTSNPLNWIDTGSTISLPIENASLALISGNIYLFGGYDNGTIKKTILSASIDDPLTWIDTGYYLPENLHSSQFTVVSNSIYLFGGINDSGPTSSIYVSSVSAPTSWDIDPGGQLPYPSYKSQFIAIGNKGYLFGPTYKTVVTPIGIAGNTRILRCDLSNPSTWEDTAYTINANFEQSQIAIINDRIFIFGGNGIRSIFASNIYLKYDMNDDYVVSYKSVIDSYTDDSESDFISIGFPPWKTNYSAL
jgi:N-acetylneuraminic acid mutarotase